MTDKRFYDWQTAGGTDDVMRLVACLERADIPWRAIGGIAVNHWAEEPMVTRDVDFVVASLEDTLTGKIAAWRDSRRRQSKRVKDLSDIIRLVEAYPQLWTTLPAELQRQIENPRHNIP